jgi:hypothetical protein
MFRCTAAVLFCIFAVLTCRGQAIDSLDCNRQIELLRKELGESKEEYQELLQSKTVVVKRNAVTDNPEKRSHTIVGMNMTSMVSRLIPYGNGVPLAGPTTLMFRKLQGERAFRFGIGLNARNDADVFNASLRIGTEKQRELNSRFVFIRGLDGILASGSFNIPGFRLNDRASTFLGALLSFGLEYRLEKNITVGTETLIMAGFQSGQNSIFGIQIVPPVAIYLHAAIK